MIIAQNMNFKLLLLVSTISLLSVFRVSATIQRSDILVINGESFELFTYPLESHPVRFTTEMLFGKTKYEYSWCWRGYVATWSIENDSLFLIRIGNDCGFGDGELMEADLSRLFKDKYRNGKIFADWVTKDLLSPRGDLLYSVFSSIYEKEIEYVIENGKLQEIKSYDNVKRKCPFYDHQHFCFKETFLKEVYQRIDWSQIPDHGNNEKQVTVEFSSNKDGIVDSVWVTRSNNDDVLYQQLAINAICGIEGFGIYARCGLGILNYYEFIVRFSSENRIKYAPLYPQKLYH